MAGAEDVQGRIPSEMESRPKIPDRALLNTQQGPQIQGYLPEPPPRSTQQVQPPASLPPEHPIHGLKAHGTPTHGPSGHGAVGKGRGYRVQGATPTGDYTGGFATAIPGDQMLNLQQLLNALTLTNVQGYQNIPIIWPMDLILLRTMANFPRKIGMILPTIEAG